MLYGHFEMATPKLFITLPETRAYIKKRKKGIHFRILKATTHSVINK